MEVGRTRICFKNKRGKGKKEERGEGRGERGEGRGERGEGRMKKEEEGRGEN